MDLKSVINIILGDLKEAADLMDELKDKPDYPELRAELAKSKCRSAGDMIRLIGDILEDLKTEEGEGAKENLTAGKESGEKEAADIGSREKEPAESEPAAKESAEKELREREAAERELAEKEAREKEAAEKELAEKEATEEETVAESREVFDETADTKPREDTEQGTEKVEEKKADKIIADRFAHLSNRMNEKVGDSKKTGGKIRTIPVTDLNRALGVNDRFYFTRELFNGNADLFRETIDKLNKASTASEAQDILSRELAGHADTEAALQLFELVERKLSAK